MNATTEYRKAHGLCIRCGLPAVPGRTMCAECAAMDNAYTKETHQWRKEHGICTYCGKAPAEHGVYCYDCWLKCTEKREQLPEEKKRKALARQNASAKERYRRLKGAGICVWCGQRPAVDGQTMCVRCRAKERARQKESRLKQTKRADWIADGLCSVCGDPVEPGYKVCPKCHQHLTDISKKHRKKKWTWGV